MARVSQQSNAGLIFVPDGFTMENRSIIAQLAAQYRLPAIYSERPFIDAGGLIRYGINFEEQFRQAGIYVDRILRGTPVGDLSIHVPMRLLLIVDEQIE
jgi:putative ABC transport system substrate-binding protein